MIEQPLETFASLLKHFAEVDPYSPAILSISNPAIDYAGLWERVQDIASVLRKAGLVSTSKVALVLPNGPDMAVAFLGVASCTICAPLNPASTDEELRFCYQNLKIDALLLRKDDQSPARRIAEEMGLLLLEIESKSKQCGYFSIQCNQLKAEAQMGFSNLNNTALILQTSGTTGVPKIVPLTHAQLLASAHNIAAHLELSQADRCINAMPLFHIHGLVGALLSSLSAGSSVVCNPGFDEQTFFDSIALHNPTWLTAVPSIHMAWATQSDLYKKKAPGHRFRFVRSSSASLPPQTLEMLRELTGAPVIESYGMTEASHQIASNPLPPGVCKIGSVGRSAGAEVAIMDAAGEILGVDSLGEIVVRGLGLTNGYQASPESNLTAFHQGWFRTGDQGLLDVEGYLFITGRLKDIVNRGGEKISPREIEEALLKHPDVLEAAAYGVPHPSLGEDLEMTVVLRKGAIFNQAQLRDFLFAALAPYKVPTIVLQIDAMPIGSTGKVQRHRLHELLASKRAVEFIAACSTVEQEIVEIFCKVMGVTSLSVKANFFVIGGDSLKATQVISRINKQFKLELPLTILFRYPTAQDLAREVEAIVSEPETPIQQLSLITSSERHQLLVTWNETSTPYPKELCIYQLFEEQVARTPNATALVFEGQQLSYSELNDQANQLAQHLICLGVGPDVLVGICLERSLELIVGLLGILKAGGAYVPLDPSYPRDRLAFMLEDTQTPVLITKPELMEQLPVFSGHLVYLDGQWLALAPQLKDRTIHQVNSENLAYVIYTSGSTGKPKGVMVKHSSLVNYVAWLQRDFSLTASDRTLQITPTSFDISMLEIFWSLTAGAQLYIAPSGANRSVAELTKLLNNFSITILQVVPSMLGALVSESSFLRLQKLRLVFTAGEALGSALTKSFYSQSSAELINGYGPTETTVYSTFWRCDRFSSGSTIPIGRPLANTQIYVLDQHRESVPCGVSGELYIGGDGLARGYLNRPELTAEKFVPNPFSKVQGARMYRTGDLARHLPDGNIEFLGRIDEQVKLRGFRIELGEIEATLAKHEQVRHSVVVVREDEPGDKRLVAYFVARSEVPTTVELRAMLKELLPEHMIPAIFVQLSAIPLTPNGKIDRKALPVPGRDTLTFGSVLPRTPQEEAVARMWCDLLRLKTVGVHDNFFELGGHSLLATQVVARVVKQFKIELPLRCFYDSPTVAALAAEVDRRRKHETGESSKTDAIEQLSRTDDIPLSFAQERMWFMDHLMPGQSVYNINSLWRVQGPLHTEALQSSLDLLVSRHEVLRTRFALVQGEPIQIIEQVQKVTIAVTDLTAMAAAERRNRADQIIEEKVRQPFSLQSGPVLRMHLIHLTDEDHLLQLTVHHIASDGWSADVLHREISVAYAALCLGQTPQLPVLPIQYSDYVTWQRSQLEGESLARQLSYWKNQLAALSALDLRTDRPRPSVQSFRGQSVVFLLPETLVCQLQTLGHKKGATLYMTLLAAFQVLLARYSGQKDIAVGSPVAGRPRVELEGLVGFFVNTLVMRSDLSDNPRFLDLLGKVRETALKAYENQDIPFNLLVADLKPIRDTSRTPLIQVMLVLQNTSDTKLELKGLQVNQVPLPGYSAKFDLTLELTQTALGLSAKFEYASDLFDTATIGRMAGHFEALLQALVADPQTPIEQIPMLSEAERHQLLVTWNNTNAPYPKELCIHELFEQQVARSPDATALVFEEQYLSYAELNARANQLAHHLIGLGVGPEVLVGICMERSTELIVGVLGILKAGGGLCTARSRLSQGATCIYAAGHPGPGVAHSTSYVATAPCVFGAPGVAGERLEASRATTRIYACMPGKFTQPS